MSQFKFYFATLGFLFLFLGTTGRIYADERNPVAEFICERAQIFYDRGESQEAVHAFSKALLVDPQNPTAHDYLQKLGTDQGLYQPLKTITVHRRDGKVQASSVSSQKDQDLSEYQNMLVLKDKEIFHLKETLGRTLQPKQDSAEETEAKDEEALLKEQKNALPAPIESVEEQAVVPQDLEDLEQLIKQRDEEIARLKEELALAKEDSLERNNFSRKIIEEKDDQIKRLVEDLQELEEKVK